MSETILESVSALFGLTEGGFIAILLMMAVTVFARTAGFFLLGRVTLTERVQRGLRALPGAVIISTIVPLALREGTAALLALLITALVMALLRKDVVAILAGLLSLALLRQAGL